MSYMWGGSVNMKGRCVAHTRDQRGSPSTQLAGVYVRRRRYMQPPSMEQGWRDRPLCTATSAQPVLPVWGRGQLKGPELPASSAYTT